MKSVNKNIISEFLLYIENQRKFSSHTIRAYKYDLNEFELFLRNYDEKVNIKDIDTSAIQYFIQSLAIQDVCDLKQLQPFLLPFVVKTPFARGRVRLQLQ